jgi:hypothetical protein
MFSAIDSRIVAHFTALAQSVMGSRRHAATARLLSPTSSYSSSGSSSSSSNSGSTRCSVSNVAICSCSVYNDVCAQQHELSARACLQF